MCVISVTTVADLQTVAGLAGDAAILDGYYQAGDGGGGTLYFETTPPPSATIMSATGVNVAITDATPTTPIVITTSVPHGYKTGQVIVVQGVGGNTRANGTWTVTVPDPLIDPNPRTLTLNGSSGNAAYTPGTGTTNTITVTCRGPHGMPVHFQVMSAGVLGNTAANGTYVATKIDNTSFSIGQVASGLYISGGFIGDGGTTFPTRDRSGATGRWIRIDQDPLNVRWFGAKGDGKALDDVPIQAALIAQNNAVSQLTIPRGTTLEGPAVYLPHGIYKIKQTLELVDYVALVSDPRTIITTDDDTLDLLRIANLNDRIINIAFVGGRSAIVFYGPSAVFGGNLGGATAGQETIIEGCEFKFQKGPSIRQDTEYDGLDSKRTMAAHIVIDRFVFQGRSFFWGTADKLTLSNGYISFDQEYRNICSSTDATPIVVQVMGHGFANGDIVKISGHDIAPINNTWTITKRDDNNFSLNGSTATGQGDGHAMGVAGRIFNDSNGHPVGCINVGASLEMHQVMGVPSNIGNIGDAAWIDGTGFWSFREVRFGGENEAILFRIRDASKGLLYGASGIKSEGLPATIAIEECGLASGASHNWLEVYDKFPAVIRIGKLSPQFTPHPPPEPHGQDLAVLPAGYGAWVDAGVDMSGVYLKSQGRAYSFSPDAVSFGAFRFRQGGSPTKPADPSASDITGLLYARSDWEGAFVADTRDGDDDLPDLNLWHSGEIDLVTALDIGSTSSPGWRTTNTDSTTGYTLSVATNRGDTGGFYAASLKPWTTGHAGHYVLSFYVMLSYDGGVQLASTLASDTHIMQDLGGRYCEAGKWRRIKAPFYHDGNPRKFVIAFHNVPADGQFIAGLMCITRGRKAAKYLYPVDDLASPTTNLTIADALRATYRGSSTTPPSSGTYIAGDTYVVDPPQVGQPVEFVCTAAPHTWAVSRLARGIGSNVASASTIAPTCVVHHVTGSDTITTIAPPANLITDIVLIPDAKWRLRAGGNIAVAMDAQFGAPIRCIYDPVTALWYPSGGITAWHPTDITSATIAFYGDSNGITQSNGVVSQFTDQGPGGNHLVVKAGQTGPAYVASGIGGRRTMRFTTNQLRSTNAINNAQPYSVFIVTVQNTWADGAYIVSSEGALQNILWQRGTSPQLQLSSGTTACANGNLAVGTAGLVEAFFNGASSTLVVNAGSASTGNPGTTSENDRLYLGSASGGSSRYEGDVAMLLVLQGTISSSELATLRTFCTNNWGVP
jgi:hypothetical protein